VSSERLTAELPGGGVYFSDRADGNMSSVGGLGHEHGAANRARLREALGLRRLARGHQVHGTFVRTVAQMPEREAATAAELEHADGQATPVKALGTIVLAADCLPVAIAGEGAVAMVHAGWRGLAAGALESGVEAVRALSPDGAPPALQAVIGPCAGGCCYEVGPEVHAALGTGVSERASVDLRAIASARLVAAGVDSVCSAGGCTICDERFFSHRREGHAAGRQAGVAWLS
jgi:polyphenol oxidase